MFLKPLKEVKTKVSSVGWPEKEGRHLSFFDEKKKGNSKVGSFLFKDFIASNWLCDFVAVHSFCWNVLCSKFFLTSSSGALTSFSIFLAMIITKYWFISSLDIFVEKKKNCMALRYMQANESFYHYLHLQHISLEFYRIYLIVSFHLYFFDRNCQSCFLLHSSSSLSSQSSSVF